MIKKSIFKKKALVILLTPFLFHGCDKPNDPEPSSFCWFTSSVLKDGPYTTRYNLVYEDDKLISSTSTAESTNGSSSTATSSYTYNSAGNLSEIISSFREVFTYTDSEITKREKFNSSNTLLYQTDYEYSNGQLIKIQEYSRSATGMTKDAYTTFEYATPSIMTPVRSKFFASPSDPNPTSTSSYEFSFLKTAFGAAPPAVQKYFKITQQYTENPISKSETNQGGKVSTVSYTYELNADGYPTKRTERDVLGVELRTTTYAYSCN